MPNNIDENNLLITLREYIEQQGYEGFFGLIAKLAPENVDKSDLDNYNKAPNITPNTIPTSSAALEQFKSPPNESVLIEEASIYAEEHIPKVQDDLMTHDQNEVIASEQSHPKIKVLEKETPMVDSDAKPASVIPNAWGDAEIKLPGEIKL